MQAFPSRSVLHPDFARQGVHNLVGHVNRLPYEFPRKKGPSKLIGKGQVVQGSQGMAMLAMFVHLNIFSTCKFARSQNTQPSETLSLSRNKPPAGRGRH